MPYSISYFGNIYQKYGKVCLLVIWCLNSGLLANICKMEEIMFQNLSYWRLHYNCNMHNTFMFDGRCRVNVYMASCKSYVCDNCLCKGMWGLFHHECIQFLDTNGECPSPYVNGAIRLYIMVFFYIQFNCVFYNKEKKECVFFFKNFKYIFQK